ncbi:MAG: flagellar hook-basal body complex protein FliE [SAR324 cluster bacterium]|nr:flagellar hook-basal body complex protein FliE [SAR324 cluster bacterium]
MIKSIIRQPLMIPRNQPLEAVPSQSAGKQIVSSFQKMFDEVNVEHLKADKMVTEMVAGKNKDISGTMIAMEKADVSSRMLMAVRNKIVNAYEEIMRMPV